MTVYYVVPFVNEPRQLFVVRQREIEDPSKHRINCIKTVVNPPCEKIMDNRFHFLIRFWWVFFSTTPILHRPIEV
jgi:hypothetical protein